ncbi:hypothetical protein EJ04DRAFT_551915 [Polyplosphaeria fusca]|uniref:Uncharacterized protein n=1 Tax=Polyplosphaeria fusca TaxID=682080 RepID=A0A9P4R216_9PLEO|nr:hypothetical protein EJ04DRAFT_551915 [Polyplosphaeria fusca]
MSPNPLKRTTSPTPQSPRKYSRIKEDQSHNGPQHTGSTQNQILNAQEEAQTFPNDFGNRYQQRSALSSVVNPTPASGVTIRPEDTQEFRDLRTAQANWLDSLHTRKILNMVHEYLQGRLQGAAEEWHRTHDTAQHLGTYNATAGCPYTLMDIWKQRHLLEPTGAGATQTVIEFQRLGNMMLQTGPDRPEYDGAWQALLTASHRVYEGEREWFHRREQERHRVRVSQQVLAQQNAQLAQLYQGPANVIRQSASNPVGFLGGVKPVQGQPGDSQVPDLYRSHFGRIVDYTQAHALLVTASGPVQPASVAGQSDTVGQQATPEAQDGHGKRVREDVESDTTSAPAKRQKNAATPDAGAGTQEPLAAPALEVAAHVGQEPSVQVAGENLLTAASNNVQEAAAQVLTQTNEPSALDMTQGSLQINYAFVDNEPNHGPVIDLESAPHLPTVSGPGANGIQSKPQDEPQKCSDNSTAQSKPARTSTVKEKPAFYKGERISYLEQATGTGRASKFPWMREGYVPESALYISQNWNHNQYWKRNTNGQHHKTLKKAEINAGNNNGNDPPAPPPANGMYECGHKAGQDTGRCAWSICTHDCCTKGVTLKAREKTWKQQQARLHAKQAQSSRFDRSMSTPALTDPDDEVDDNDSMLQDFEDALEQNKEQQQQQQEQQLRVQEDDDDVKVDDNDPLPLDMTEALEQDDEVDSGDEPQGPTSPTSPVQVKQQNNRVAQETATQSPSSEANAEHAPTFSDDGEKSVDELFDESEDEDKYEEYSELIIEDGDGNPCDVHGRRLL